MMTDLGAWALDEVVDGRMKSIYFKTRDDADVHIRTKHGPFALRRVNLEDVFVSITGKKVAPS
jgi:ABC-2 type transport system ATP-binding protein